MSLVTPCVIMCCGIRALIKAVTPHNPLRKSPLDPHISKRMKEEQYARTGPRTTASPRTGGTDASSRLCHEVHLHLSWSNTCRGGFWPMATLSGLPGHRPGPWTSDFTSMARLPPLSSQCPPSGSGVIGVPGTQPSALPLCPSSGAHDGACLCPPVLASPLRGPGSAARPRAFHP